MVPAGGAAADIGAGDGQVALALSAAGHRVVASEAAAGPFARLPPELDRRLGDGLSVLRPGEVDGVVIAGMGGRTIAAIVAAEPELAGSLRWLVLQPQQHLKELLEFLQGAGYSVQAERDVAEARRSYRVLLVTPPR